MYDLTAFQRDVLYAVASSEGAKGLELKHLLRDYYEQEIYDGRIYPALDELSDKGLVSKSKLDNRTNQYRLTERGVSEMERRRRWENEQAPATLGGEAE